MESMGTTHVDLTPWAASVLPLSTIANLRTLLLEGEKVRLPDVLRWSEHARVVNFYGPSECTPNSTVATYTGTNTACFGYLTSGRDAPIRGLNDSVGAYTNVLICQLDSLWAKEPHELVQEVLRQMLEDTDFQHCPLANIQQALDLAPGQQLYNSLLSIQRLESPQSSSGKTPCLTFTAIDGQDPTELSLMSDHPFATLQQADRILSVFQSMLGKIVDNKSARQKPSAQAREICRTVTAGSSSEDLIDIWTWNATAPAPVRTCVHDLIANTVSERPSAIAISAWDGEQVTL
ncbi:Nonribosomal peptide synthetase 8 [Fulvia fulva]|uniref:Nonribosomal peptide synthetase 8 n=1 Tax=Passalora fulva TaxID=5499 RepID=A0A9Q8UUT0_PASFU|nr:Nonribosomal peptide synthetase 8 [Fulvia fulva]KAK4626397.1 Nonribosomal peptide synthetase 8 [Fulvia fulva]KAK4627665.1 Nonribosomal peptide synthetase 8 [Fulvia fulva]UJO23097.1 Nonribosomal peptide synthetase 8 [Fulvia fulva]WPV14099.1 Nonribosomal peptide synthetase 8 [Fulvia fulva]WPV28493.1 Nonribosomal peptide synthetase 8 [Fulvia fulva]